MKQITANTIFLLLMISVNARNAKPEFHSAVDSIIAITKVIQPAYFNNLTALYGNEGTAPEVTVKTKETALTKQEAIDYIKSYYADFKTGSDQYSYDYGISKPGYAREYRNFTGNYKVEITNCKFKMTFDSYKWPYKEMKGTTVIAFDLSAIDSIKQGAGTLLEISDQPGAFVEINAAILFHFKKNNNATVLYKEDKDELPEKVNEVDLKTYQFPWGTDFTDNKIVQAFERLRELCNK